MLGRAVATRALLDGHEVTCLARGVAGDVPEGVRWVRADRDLPDGLLGVTGTGARWDAVVDVSRQPGQVRRAVAALEPVTSRYVFVSTTNVYADHSRPATDETVALLPALDGDVMTDMST